ncbi:hypothetical protein [uncultured Paraglaciecola sp.]|uniref:hypothetical protein n=1 Tax=uncultured Paraglaciecola sp. TaxID=1765024 RepID=UPI00261A0004|nr:hypothetical protein [uncultured Paraglaciecola sp.]
MNKFFKILIVCCLVTSFVTQAKLIRGGGRGSETSTSPNSYYLIDDSWVVLNPNGSPTLDGYTYNDAFSASPRKSTTSGKYDLLVVPFDGCAEEYTYDTYEGVPPEFLPDWGGCTWEFTENERLFVYGDFPLYLENAFDYEVVFTITNDSGDRWDISGNDTYVDTSGGTVLEDGGETNTGMVILDAQRPANLGPGEYKITVSVEMFSGPNKTFFHYQDENSGLNVDCVPTAGPDDFCFVSSGLNASDTLSFSADFSETFRIVVDSPNSVSLCVSAMLLIFYRRRKCQNAFK